MQILTHRGLDPDRPNYFSESSFEAFADQLKRGYGLEFDLGFTHDNRIIVLHDSTLTRLTSGKDNRAISDIRSTDIPSLLTAGHVCYFEELMREIQKYPHVLHAIHFKGKLQTDNNIKLLINNLHYYDSELLNRLILFDITPITAVKMLAKPPHLHLAPSVSHEFDIKRYDSVVSHTLISIQDALKYRKNNLYDWVWLDEWDRSDENGGQKTLYNWDVFSSLRAVGYYIALVTPELHGTSPGLLGGEAHPDTKDAEKLYDRIKKILELHPDAVCTDHPDKVAML
jgi:glycerophosphoryl diester phosphodiesterase